MSCLFIGQGDIGSTSKGRFEAISRIDRVHDWILYDVSPLLASPIATSKLAEMEIQIRPSRRLDQL